MPEEKSKSVEDKNLIESLHYLKQNNLLPNPISTVKFETAKEAEDSSKEDVTSLIKEKTNAAKQDITELQKAGYNLHLETIKLISIPLKTKIWLSHPKKSNLEKILGIINEVNKIILPLKKENEEKIKEKERLEKEAEEFEKLKEKTKESNQKLKTTT